MAEQYPSFKQSCGPGDKLGILGINCRHSYAPFFPGISERAYNPDDYKKPDIEYKGKTYSYYEMTQKQRGLEQKVKALKRDLIAQNAAIQAIDGDMQEYLKREFDATAHQLRKATDSLEDFCKQTGLEYQPQRVKYYGYDRSLAAKVNAGNRRWNKEREK